MTAPMMPQAPMAPPTPPWTPFEEEPVDAEPHVAAIRKRRLGRLLVSTEFAKFPTEWKQAARDAYWRMVQAIQAAQQAEVTATVGRPSPARDVAPASPANGPTAGLVAG